ncbi:hypothetical protein L1887_29423 [Cichorium endivia]|nr:hypothetical protein L1887_29423 [Cichorium endivia]
MTVDAYVADGGKGGGSSGWRRWGQRLMVEKVELRVGGVMVVRFERRVNEEAMICMELRNTLYFINCEM